MSTHLENVLVSVGLTEAELDALAGSLVWRVGRLSEDGPVTVRVGLASSVPVFNELPKLRSASDGELTAAIEEDNVRVEWVGRAPG